MIKNRFLTFLLFSFPVFCYCQLKVAADSVKTSEIIVLDTIISGKKMPKDFNEKNNRYNKYGNKNLDFSDWAFRPDLYGPVKTQKLTVFSAVTANDLRDVGYESYILNERYDTLGMRYMESLYTLKNLLVAKSAILHHKDGFATEILYTDLFDNLLNRLAYEYYPNGNWKRVTNYDTYYVPFEIIYYNYTDNGDISEIRKTDDGGNIISREIFLYDDNGNKIQSNVYDASGAEFSRTDFLYNIKNNLISYRTIENGDSLKVYYEADYQGDTLLLKDLKEITLLGEIISVTENEFDPLGNVLTQKINYPTTQKKEEKIYLYKWDLWGNWTEIYIDNNGQINVLAQRELTYYTNYTQ